MNLTEEQLRMTFLSVINKYTNTHDDEKAIEYGMERVYSILKEQEAARNTTSPIPTIKRQNTENPPNIERIVARYTNEYYLDNEKEMKEL